MTTRALIPLALATTLAGRARAFQSMVGGGMDVSKAAGLAGLMEVEG